MLLTKLISMFKTKSKVSLKTKFLGLISHVKGIKSTEGSKDTDQPVHMRIFCFVYRKQ